MARQDGVPRSSQREEWLALGRETLKSPLAGGPDASIGSTGKPIGVRISLLILIQKGKGGGLSGTLGGIGMSGVLGSKTGDFLTWVTVTMVGIFLLLAVILDKYHRPTIILTIKDDVAVGSGRSIDGFNIQEAMNKLKDLFIKFGGHYHAAGCTLDVSNIEALSSGIEEIAEKTLSDMDLVPSITVDAEVNLDELTFETVYDLRSLEPFGADNPEPVLCSKKLEILNSRIVGEKHLKLKVRQEQTVHEAIGFNFGDLHPLDGMKVNLVYTPEINSWNGNESVQLRILDVEISGDESKLVKN